MSGTAGRHKVLHVICSLTGRSGGRSSPLHVVNAFAARALPGLGRTGGKANEITETRCILLGERLGPERFLKAARTGLCKIRSIGSWM